MGNYDVFKTLGVCSVDNLWLVLCVHYNKLLLIVFFFFKSPVQRIIIYKYGIRAAEWKFIFLHTLRYRGTSIENQSTVTVEYSNIT